MICPSCKTKNQYYHRFCYYCGYKLDKPNPTLEATRLEPFQDSTQSEIEKEYEQLESSNSEQKAEELNLEELEELDVYPSETEEEEINENTEEDTEKNIEAITDSQQNLYDYLFSGYKTNDFDISREIPLRRYRKNKSKNVKRPIKYYTFIIATALVAFAIFMLLRETGNDALRQVNNSQSIIVSTVVNPVNKEGTPAHQIIFNTTNGKEVKILDTVIPVKDGRAELILEDSFLYSLNPVEGEDGILEVHLDSIISAPGFPDTRETVSIPLTQSYAPLTLIQPSSNEAIIEGSNYQLVFSVEPGSKVFINDNDYTDLVSEDGKMKKDIIIPPEEDEILVTIKVSLEGFEDNIQQIVLKRPVMEVPITINETSPIPSQGQWVKISGTTLPGATLTTDRETKEKPKVNPETGEFIIYVKTTYPGYTPCTLTANIDEKVSSTEIILDGETNIDIYTSTAWKPEYDKMQQNPELHNGQHFLFNGTVKDILLTGQKNVFTVDTSSEPDIEQLIHVEYWGDSFNFQPGDGIRVFGNRWKNVGDMPRILAKYIYER